MNKKIFHLHIPKTAGSFVNQYLRQNFGKAFIHENPYLSSVSYSKAQVEGMLSFYSFECYAGHVFNLGNVPLGFDINGFSFVRNPIDKFISFYFFQRGRHEVKDTVPLKKHTIEDYVKFVQNEQPNTISTDGSQLQWVAGSTDANVGDIKTAIKSGYYSVFPQEKMEQALFVLSQQYKSQLHTLPILKKVNPSARDQQVSDEVLADIAQLPWISEDLELHDLAIKNLEYSLRGNEDDFQSWLAMCHQQKVDKVAPTLTSKVKSKIKKYING